MRLFVFVGHYPSPYKPYYDTQFADFLHAGHELRIFAAHALDDTVNEKVVSRGLRERTSYYPESGRAAGFETVAGLMARPLGAARFIASTGVRGARRTAVNLLRWASLPRERPDAILVHELAVAMKFEWLRSWYGNVPVGLYYHGGEVASVEQREGEAVARAFRSVDVVFTNTGFSRDHAIGRGCPPDRIMVLPVGFDFADYQPAASRSYRPGGRLELLSAGRMSEEKGFLYSLDALRRVIETGRRDIRYSFTGEGYVRSQLEAYVDEHALHEHVRFLGRLTTAQVIAAMGEADALVLPSVTVGNWTENQACAVQEAMLMKALVITAQTGGVPESIPAVFKRFSAPERNAADLAQAITSVYDLTPAQLTELGHEGRKFVETGYDIEQLNRTMLTALLNSTRDRRVPFAK